MDSLGAVHLKYSIVTRHAVPPPKSLKCLGTFKSISVEHISLNFFEITWQIHVCLSLMVISILGKEKIIIYCGLVSIIIATLVLFENAC